MFRLVVTYEMKPGMKKSFLDEVFASGIPGCTLREKGCIGYEFFSACEGEKAVLLEKWESGEHLDAHREQPHFKVLSALKEKYVENTVIEKYEC